MRILSSGALTALQSPEVPLIMLVEMRFEPVLYVCTAAVPVVWGGQTWLGAGPLGAVEVVRDAAGEGQALQFGISGVPSENVALALGQSARNRVCIVRLAVLNAATHAIEDVSTVGTYVLDQLQINGSMISVTALPMSRIFQRPKPVRYTDGDQQLVSSGDRALEFLVSQAQHQDVWPAASWGRV